MATRVACGDLHSIQGGLHRCSQQWPQEWHVVTCIAYKVVCIGAVNNGYKIWHVVTCIAYKVVCIGAVNNGHKNGMW